MPRYAARRNQTQGLVHRERLSAGIENGLGDLHDVLWQRPMPDGVFRHKLKKGRVPKVVATFKYDVLTD